MRMINKNDFLKRSVETLREIFDMLTKLPILQLKDLQGKKTAFVIVDMINGFAGLNKTIRLILLLLPVIVQIYVFNNLQ